MITTETVPGSYKYPTHREALTGVVRISVENPGSNTVSFGTGSLLWTGHHILTAAHLIYDEDTGQRPDIRQISVHFDNADSGLDGSSTMAAKQVRLHPGYDISSSNADLALITLQGPAPGLAERYSLYRDQQEADFIATLAGYGHQGTGYSGEVYDSEQLVRAQNQLELTPGSLQQALGYTLNWQPDPDSLLVADFDSGYYRNDTLGQITGQPGPGTGITEGMIASGDSGGPAFISQQVAGVASYTSSLIQPDTDSDNLINSSYGELGFWQRVSSYQQWIDQSLRADYETEHLYLPREGSADNDSLQPDKTAVTQPIQEGDQESQIIFFLLELLNASERGQTNDEGLPEQEPMQWLSVDYTTRDGTATAGEDYIPVSGRINLYPDENHAWIPVEVIADTRPEPDEDFYLTVSNPQGVGISNGATEMTARRVILDDDGWLL